MSQEVTYPEETTCHHSVCMPRADEVIATSDENLVTRVKEITNRKLAYAAVDPIGGDFTKDVAAATRPGGTVYVRILTMCEVVHICVVSQDVSSYRSCLSPSCRP